MIELVSSLIEQGVDKNLLEKALKFADENEVEESYRDRLVEPDFVYYGRDVWNMAIAAILQGENILLSGPKATGKNLLADNLTALFKRPGYNISFNVTTDSASLIGTDTFVNNEVSLRKGAVYQCAESGGFCVFDEVNMAKNDAVSVLHSALDHRRIIDVPGYEKIKLNPATRFIGTMNYGYAGTRELNEALVSRFLVIDMPQLDEITLMHILKVSYPDAKEFALSQFCGLFMDLQLKAFNSEISTKSVDMRGLLAAIGTIKIGFKPLNAIQMGDVVKTRVPSDWEPEDIF